MHACMHGALIVLSVLAAKTDLQDSMGTSGMSTQEPEAEDEVEDDDGPEEGYCTPPRKSAVAAELTPDNMETQAFDMDALLFAGLTHDCVHAYRPHMTHACCSFHVQILLRPNVDWMLMWRSFRTCAEQTVACTPSLTNIPN